jgi:hypothetical protein
MKCRRVAAGVMISLCLLIISAPCWAWLFDGGMVGNGLSLNDGSTQYWAAAPFMLDADSYASKFGTALSRSALNTSFTVYLTPSLANITSSALAQWTISPTGPIMQYYYVQPSSPILLNGNTPYFLVVMPSDVNSYGGISFSSYGYYGFLSSDHGMTWYRQAMPLAVRVDGSVVPELGGLSMLAIGIGMILAPLRRSFNKP